MRAAPEVGMLQRMHPVHVYQILNYYTLPEDLDPGFDVLDNSANERPDWYEYWPIRNYLLNERLDESAFYGFLSPKFKLKTNLDAARVRAFIDSSCAAADVVLFSPSIHNSAYYWHVFEHGEAEHPGLAQLASDFFERIDKPVDWREFVSDSTNTVHANYFLAKPRFWRAWLAVTEQLFTIAETPGDALGRALCRATDYRGATTVPMKIFLMERVATWLLASDSGFSARVRDPFAARSRFYKLPIAIVCDALKIAYVSQRRAQYRDVFVLMRKLHKFFNLQLRLGEVLGWRRVRPSFLALKSYWYSNE